MPNGRAPIAEVRMCRFPPMLSEARWRRTPATSRPPRPDRCAYVPGAMTDRDSPQRAVPPASRSDGTDAAAMRREPSADRDPDAPRVAHFDRRPGEPSLRTDRTTAPTPSSHRSDCFRSSGPSGRLTAPDHVMRSLCDGDGGRRPRWPPARPRSGAARIGERSNTLASVNEARPHPAPGRPDRSCRPVVPLPGVATAVTRSRWSSAGQPRTIVSRWPSSTSPALMLPPSGAIRCSPRTSRAALNGAGNAGLTRPVRRRLAAAEGQRRSRPQAAVQPTCRTDKWPPPPFAPSADCRCRPTRLFCRRK